MSGTEHQPDYRVHLALLFVQLSFGGFSVVGKYALAHVQPLALASLRVAFAAPLLLFLSMRYDRGIPAPRELIRIAILGFFGVFVNQVLFIIGLNYTTAINASILMPSIPVFTTAIAMLFGIERLTVGRAVAIALSVAGALIMLDVTKLSFSGDATLGNMLVLINCFSYSFFLVYARPVLMRVPALTVTAWTFMFGGAGVLIVGGRDLLSTDFQALPVLAWWSLAYIVLLPTLVNYLLNIWAIRRSSSSLVAAYTTLQPVAATALAVSLLGEAFGVKEIAGFVLIVAGLLKVTSRPRGAVGLVD